MTRLAADEEQQLSAYFEEYRVLYDLVVFRMTALDRRAPVTAGAFAATIVGLQVLPSQSQVMLLVLVPIALIWLMRTTVNHARSFEDVLRRIEFIEKSVNVLVGKRALGFQSLHPSRGRRIGGRTGHESVLAVLGSIQLVLAFAAYQMHGILGSATWEEFLYICLLVMVSALSIRETVKLSRYRYGATFDAA